MPNDNTVIVLDVETTGLDYLREKIIEFAAVKMVNNEIVEEYETLINPQQEIRKSSIEIHGITQEMVENEPTMDQVLPKILEFIGDYPMIGHNVIFDYNFLNQASLAHYEKKLENRRIDTQHMFREIFPEEFSHGLQALLKRFDVECTTRHRAMADAKNLALAYPALKELYEQKYRWQLDQLPNIDYLFERFLRIQSAVQTMQSELSDIKSVFKVHFENGGESLQSSTGEKLIQTSKVSHNYDFDEIMPIIEELGAQKRVIKYNTGLIDRMINGQSLDDEIKAKLAAARTKVSESKTVTIVKTDKNISDFTK